MAVQTYTQAYGSTLATALTAFYQLAVTANGSGTDFEGIAYEDTSLETLASNPIRLMSKQFLVAFDGGTIAQGATFQDFCASIIAGVNAGETISTPLATFTASCEFHGQYGPFYIEYDDGL